MKRILIQFLICSVCGAQNLIPNGDFEQYSICPDNFSQLWKCNNWFNPTNATPDYFNACSGIGTNANVPYTWMGYQNAHGGAGICGIYVYQGLTGYDYREYIEVQLTTLLSAGNCYYFEMYCSAGNDCKNKSSDVGVYFSDTLIDSVQQVTVLNFVPQIQNPVTNPIDTLNWTLVSGYYTATGGEQYIIIGNFYNDSLTHLTISHPSVPNPRACVLIDDISLSVCTGMEEFNKLDISVAPNPFTDKLTITSANNEPYELVLTDVMGRQVLKAPNPQGGLFVVETGYLSKGVYFATLRNKEKVVTVKVLKR